MEGCELGQKAACLQADLPTADLLGGALDEAQERHLVAALDAMHAWPLHIDHRPAQRLEVIASKARRLAARCARAGKPLALLGVDYLQLLRAPGDSGEERIAEVSRGLKALAKELRLPVLALAQLNRKSEERSDKRPTKADLRSSGQIEQDADILAFPFRPYAAGDETRDPGEAELLFCKYRSGEEGIVSLAWDGSRQRFGDAPNVRHLPTRHGGGGGYR
jgi:replicative DNA helicase